MAQAWNPSHLAAETGGLQTQGQPDLQSEFKSSLGSSEAYFKIKRYRGREMVVLGFRLVVGACIACPRYYVQSHTHHIHDAANKTGIFLIFKKFIFF